MNILGKLDWSAIPFDQPIVMGASAMMVLASSPSLSVDHAEGILALSVARVDHLRRPQAHRRHVHRAGAGHAAARLRRRDHDALAAGVAAGGAQGYLPPEHFDQIFSAHGTIMIFFMAMPFVIGLMNFAVPLQLGVRDVAFPTLNSVSLWLTASGILLTNISLVVGEFAQDRLGRLSAAQRAAVLARRRRRLLSLGAADLRHRHAADRHQFRHHHPEDARAGHELHAHAGVLLDRARHEPADRRGLSGPDRDVRDAAARPLSRLPLLHGRRPGQPDDVREPDLGLGPSGSLHPDPAGIRRLLGGDLDLLRQAAVRLPLDGRRDHGDLRALLPRLAAPLLHHGRQRRRQRLLRHHDA